jgi:hypothetical protein
MEPAATDAEATTAAETPEMRRGKAPGLLKVIGTLETPLPHLALPVQLGFIGTSAGT